MNDKGVCTEYDFSVVIPSNDGNVTFESSQKYRSIEELAVVISLISGSSIDIFYGYIHYINKGVDIIRKSFDEKLLLSLPTTLKKPVGIHFKYTTEPW